MKQKTIYPEIDIHVTYHMNEKSMITFETYLRKVYRRKYYLWKFHREVEFGSKIFTPEDVLASLVRFQTEIYRCQILGKVNPKLKYETNGLTIRPVFERDTDQTPENERLMPSLKQSHE